jgi:hypothetical protein
MKKLVIELCHAYLWMKNAGLLVVRRSWCVVGVVVVVVRIASRVVDV